MPEADPSIQITQPKTFTHIKILLAARLAIVSFFMGIVVFYRMRFGVVGNLIPAMEPIGVAYLLTICYAIYLNFVKNAVRFAYVQLSIDLLLVTWIIYYTGGVNSPFSFMFILIIIGSAYFRAVSAPYALATAASVLYTGILYMEYMEIIQPRYPFPPLSDSGNIYYMVLMGFAHITTFYFIAFMSGYFTRLLIRSDKELVRKSEDFTMLQAFHENVLNNMGLGFFAIDLDRTILSHNPASERILHLDSDDIKKKSADKILGLPELTHFFTELENISRPSSQFDWTYKSPEGNNIHMSMTLSKFVAHGSTQGVIAVFQDVTALRNLEKQVAESERLAAIGRVAAAIAHEIRNPLASLSGSIQVLSSDLAAILDEQNKRLMDIIMRETDRLNNIIGQFLGYASQPTLNLIEADISKLLSETWTLLKANPEYADKIIFDSDLPPDVVACVDQELIKQVIWNLCANGIDAMQDGGTLAIKAYNAKAPWECMESVSGVPHDSNEMVDCVCVSVRDTGIGITEENIKNVFEPFYTTKSYGTGLGLSTVHKIVKSHHGRIETVSEPGKGTTFTVWIPVDHQFTRQIAKPDANTAGAWPLIK